MSQDRIKDRLGFDRKPTTLGYMSIAVICGFLLPPFIEYYYHPQNLELGSTALLIAASGMIFLILTCIKPIGWLGQTTPKTTTKMWEL